MWRERNNELLNKVHASANETLYSAVNFLTDWCATNFIPHAQKNVAAAAPGLQISRWRKPKPMFFKCNVDAALRFDRNTTGIGMIIRDDKGEFVVARTITYPGVFAPKEAEAIGVREALSWIKSLCFHQVVVESDAKYVVEGIYSTESGVSEYDNLIEECRALLQGEPNISMAFVRRSGNEVSCL
ncbi:hypothetical protein DH2020_044454 [Rehmannia glutinosa]|uniref:RNase H type-1 domain-containing protein n=1 Tax=Rehmannia glutinosa TaxID=99300 RepID=A0ABR0UIK2_REHGL